MIFTGKAKAYLIPALLVFVIVFPVQAEDSILTLQDYIRQARQVNRTFEEILAEGLAISFNRQIALPAPDLLLETRGGLVFNAQDLGMDGSERIALSRLFPDSGISWSLEAGNSHRMDELGLYPAFSGQVSVPLVRNAFGQTYHLQKEQLELADKVLCLQVAEAYEDHLASLIELYYDWYLAYVQVNTAQSSYEQSRKLLEDIQNKQRYSIASGTDVNRVRMQLMDKEETLVRNRAAFLSLTAGIADALGMPELKDQRPGPLPGVEDAAVPTVDIEELIKSSRTVRIHRYTAEADNLAIDQIKAAMLPGLDVYAGIARSELQARNSEMPELQGGVVYRHSFPATQDTARLEQAGWQKKKRDLATTNQDRSLVLALSRLREDMSTTRWLIDNTSSKIDLAASIVKDETYNYRIGRTSLDQLIRAIDELDQLNERLLTYQVQKEKQKIGWLRLTDRLIGDDPEL